MLASSYRSGAGTATGTRFVSSGKSDDAFTTYTFPGLALGEPDPTRLIVVCFGSRGGFQTNAVTVAGVAATFLVRMMQTDYSAIWVAAVPEGETGDVVVTLSATAQRGMVAVYALYGLSPTPVWTGAGSATATTAPDGFLIANSIKYQDGLVKICTWTGVKQDHADLADGIINYSAASAKTTSGSLAYVANWQGSGSGALSAAAFAPLPDEGLPVTAGLAGWFDASDVSTLSFSSGQVVSQWRDKSGLDRHFAQADVTKQPSHTGLQNGLPTLDFALSPADMYFDTAAFPFEQPLTVFIAQNAAAVNTAGWFGSVGEGYQIFVGDGALIIYSTNSVATGVTHAGLHAWSFTLDGAASRWAIDGGGFRTGTVNPVPGSVGWRTAERNLTPDYRPRGQVFEIIVYNRAMTDTEHAAINAYLGEKWGIFSTLAWTE